MRRGQLFDTYSPGARDKRAAEAEFFVKHQARYPERLTATGLAAQFNLKLETAEHILARRRADA